MQEARKNNDNNKLEQFLVNLQKTDAINTSEKLSKIADVSEKTYRMGKKILDSNNEEVKEKYNSTVGRPSKNNCSPNGEQSKNKLHTDKELAKLEPMLCNG